LQLTSCSKRQRLRLRLLGNSRVFSTTLALLFGTFYECKFFVIINFNNKFGIVVIGSALATIRYTLGQLFDFVGFGT